MANTACIQDSHLQLNFNHLQNSSQKRTTVIPKNKEICSCFVGENNSKSRKKTEKHRTFLKFCRRFSVIPCDSSRKISEQVYNSTKNKAQRIYFRPLTLSFNFEIITSRKIENRCFKQASLHETSAFSQNTSQRRAECSE